MPASANVDNAEKHKFDALAPNWWDPHGPLRTLHHINPLRLEYITRYIDLNGKSLLDIGCGGGLLCEALARQGAQVTGIDISPAPLATARQHCQQSGLVIDYELSGPEQFAQTHPYRFDAVTCMEMLEHVPDPGAVINACATLIKPGGHLFFSTINRTASAWLQAVLGAEYVLNILPRGTHDYSRFIRPSELAEWCRQSGLTVMDISGMTYLPLLDKAILRKNPAVNYLLYARRCDD